jgi:hypothetical protein
LTPYLQPYKQNLLNFRHHFLFGISSKISSFWHYFTDKALNKLFKFVCRLRNVSKNKNFEFSHNLKWYIIRISFERVLHNIQKNLLLIVSVVSHTLMHIHGVSKKTKSKFSMPLCVNYSVYECNFFIIITIRLLAVEWHVFHPIWRIGEQIRVR